MIQALVRRKLDRAEKELGAPIDEMRYVAKHSLSALRAWGSVHSWAHYRKAMPAEAFYVAKIAAYRQEDCGTCLQIAVNLAKKAGVKTDLIRAAMEGRVSALPGELRMVYRFAEQQANGQDDPELREQIRLGYGDEALIDLAFAIVGSRAFPTFKRVLGYAKSCTQVTIEV